MPYDHRKIEYKWQEYWDSNHTFETSENPTNAYYCLDMFPYPSGDGLHVGHPKGYTATDIVSRMKRAQGFQVLHPMGWDAFGLPAENFAIKTGIHPRETTKKSIERFRSQLKRLGFSYDWEREINTSDPEYFRWTQWLFLKLYERGLAYQKTAAVNWCPSDQTVLANEQVVEGCCNRCGSQVVQKQLKQWFFKITEYADELLDQLDLLNWPEQIKAAQRNWIGKSQGAEIAFATQDHELNIPVFTTRPETLYGVTYLVLAPENPVVEILLRGQDEAVVKAVNQYIEKTNTKTELVRKMETNEKTGIFTGAYALHPLTGENLPIWIADYVLASYGTGAVMAVPGHDERDWDFAKAHNLSIRIVVDGGVSDQAFTGEGILVNSAEWNGKHSEADRADIIASLASKKFGAAKTQYRLRDWLVSRQRYWGAPIPILYCETCGTQAVPEDQLPVVLPDDVDFKPTGESPLARSESFQIAHCPKCGGIASRESDTMDTFVDSSWYYLRYIDSLNAKEPASLMRVAEWLPVDLYVGGAEHAVLHLLYARFMMKAFDDMFEYGIREPFLSLRNVGLIQGEDGRKMSKSLGNVINPDEVVDLYGADTLRLYEMFIGPFEDSAPWNTRSMIGIRRWLDRVWSLQSTTSSNLDQQLLHKQTNDLAKLQGIITKHIEEFRFNTAISALMIATKSLLSDGKVDTELYGVFIRLIAPFAPHIAEELWSELGNKTSISLAPWPEIEVISAGIQMVTVAVQVNGKIRGTIRVAQGLSQTELVAQAKELPNVSKYLEGHDVRVLVVPDKIVNFMFD